MKKLIAFLITFLILSVLLSLRLWQTFSPSKPTALFNFEKVKFETSTTLPTQSLQVLSGNPVGEFQNETLKSLKIIGEVKNIGGSIINSAVPVVSFVDAGDRIIKKIIAAWDTNYFLPALAPGEKYFYALKIVDPPADFASILVNFETEKKANTSPRFSQNLMVQDRQLQENTASDSAGMQAYYYRLTGALVNVSSKKLRNAAVFAYVLDADNKVFAWAQQSFPSDLFEENQSQPFNILLIPVKSARAVKSEVFVFAEEL